MYHNYTNYQSQNKRYSTPYTPKKKVKNFTDLDVYQKAHEASVFCGNEIVRAAEENRNEFLHAAITEKLVACALSIPRLIAESHGKRFGTSQESLDILDAVMLNCNLMVVYLEQARDLLKLNIEHDRWEEQTKNYFYIRQKVLNLQRVWRKYINENQQQQQS